MPLPLSRSSHRERRALVALAATACCLAAQASAIPERTASLLAANRIASGGDAWAQKQTLQLDYTYRGNGLTGTASSTIDLQHGFFVDATDMPPTSNASGYDGTRPWMRDASGAVSPQQGGDRVPLAVNEAYRNANRWWRDEPDARLGAPETRRDEGRDYDVIEVEPRGGKPFEAWFDRRSHLLARVVEAQMFFIVTTRYDDYRAVAGAMLAHRIAGSTSLGPDSEVLTLARARFGPRQPASRYAPPAWSRANLSLPGGTTTVPFQLLNNHVYIDVLVNGKGPFRFICDTGGHNIVTRRTARALGLVAAGESQSSGAGDNTASTGYLRLDTLQIGALTVSRSNAFVLDFSAAASEGFADDGMIGFDIFRRFVTTFDYGAKTLTLTEPGRFDPRDAGTAIPFLLYDHNVQVQGRIDGVPARLHLDTGSRVEVTLTKPFADAHDWKAKHPNGALAIDGWGVGGPSRSYVVRGRELELGNVASANVIESVTTQSKGAFADPNYDGNVGSAFLKRFVVTLDYDRQQLYLKPVAAPIADTAVFDRAGMWVNAGDEAFDVVDVTPGGPAADAGLQVGDRIAAIDGRAVRPAELPAFRYRLRNDTPGTTLTLSVVNGSERFERRLTLRDLL